MPSMPSWVMLMFSSSSSSSYSSSRVRNDISIVQQAPDAADAARLYGQLQDKAENKVEEIIIHQLKDISIQFATMEASRSPMNFTEEFRVMAKINGKPVTASVTFEDVERQGGDHVRAAYQKLSEELAQTIMQQVMLNYLAITRTHRFR